MRNFCPIVFHSLTDVLPVHLRFRSVAVRRRYLLLCLIAQLAILSLIWLLHNLISGHLLPVLSTIYSSITRKVKHSSRFSNRKLQTKSSQATVFLLSHLPYSTIYKGDNRIKTPIQKSITWFDNSITCSTKRDNSSGLSFFRIPSPTATARPNFNK